MVHRHFAPLRWCGLMIVLLTPVLTRAADTTSHSFSIARILRTEAFKPTFPTEKALIKTYGAGILERIHNEAFRIYHDKKAGLWVGCRVEEDDQLYRPITGIVLSKLPLSRNRSVPEVTLSYTRLHELRIGDSVGEVLRRCGEPRRTYMTPWAQERSLLVYEYFPKQLSEGSCLRFYAQNDTVVAMSFSSEE